MFFISLFLSLNCAFAEGPNTETTKSQTTASPETAYQPLASSVVEKIHPFKVITELPDTGLRTLKGAFTDKRALWPWLGITVSTLILYDRDDKILKDIQRDGRNSGIGNGDNTRTVFSVGPYSILRLPSDTGSMLYFLGDGWMHMGIAAGFFATGYLGDHPRAWNTGMQMVHGMFVSTFFNQALKRSTGRESPNRATEPRGKWRLFPSVEAYNKNTAMYDAMPSGHIMTGTLVFTIMYTNYPEYGKAILPLSVLWLTALGWQMVNNGVHWASDYPLGIAMGYYIGKLATDLGKQPKKEEKTATSRFMILPMLDETGTPLLSGVYLF